MDQSHQAPGADQVTQWLQRWRDGEDSAFEKLFDALYDQLRAMADHYMRQESPGRTIQATALVHEAYLRICGTDLQWQSRSHFLGVMAQVMRRLLVDQARARRSAKRGEGAQHLKLDDIVTLAANDDAPILALEDAMLELGRADPRKEKVVEMHYFGGLSYAEIAQVLDISQATVDRDLRMAKAWLKCNLETG